MQRLSEILATSSKQFPERLAIIDPGQAKLTYQEFSEECDVLSNLLAEHQISTGDRIGILMPKSADSVIAILGILALQGVYIPMDVSAPVSRNVFIFHDCKVKAILIQNDLLADYVDHIPAKVLQIPNRSFHLMLCDFESEQSLEVPKDLAYILYTSGSTGTPKGVMITHRNALSFVDWSCTTFDLSEQDIFSSIAPFHFDLSIFDLFVSLRYGAALVLFNQQTAKNPLLIAALIAEHNISVWYSTPSLLKVLLRYGKPQRHDHSSLRIVLFAGEVFDISALRKIKEIWSQAKFHNLYGPTETNVVTWYPIPDSIADEQVQPYPIGKSCPHVQCKLWKEEILEAAPGREGELIVTGKSVTPGYLNLPNKNSDVFFLDAIGQRWYKTGDLVKVDEANNFVYIGRVDRMIKRRGYRIELGEIESVLAQHEGLAEAVVVAATSLKKGPVLRAFLCLQHKQVQPNSIELREHCLQYIPLYMLPDQFIFLQELPKTSTHKINYQELKSMSYD